MTGARMPKLEADLPDIDAIRRGCDLVRRTFQTVRGEIGRDPRACLAPGRVMRRARNVPKLPNREEPPN